MLRGARGPARDGRLRQVREEARDEDPCPSCVSRARSLGEGVERQATRRSEHQANTQLIGHLEHEQRHDAEHHRLHEAITALHGQTVPLTSARPSRWRSPSARRSSRGQRLHDEDGEGGEVRCEVHDLCVAGRASACHRRRAPTSRSAWSRRPARRSRQKPSASAIGRSVAIAHVRPFPSPALRGQSSVPAASTRRTSEIGLSGFRGHAQEEQRARERTHEAADEPRERAVLSISPRFQNERNDETAPNDARPLFRGKGERDGRPVAKERAR